MTLSPTKLNMVSLITSTSLLLDLLVVLGLRCTSSLHGKLYSTYSNQFLIFPYPP